MPQLDNYRQFEGLHWETGTVRNFLDYRGVTAPHTGRPYSEALLMGVSGGAAMGYFSFAYEGYDPMARILTRNTFDPWMNMLSRLGVVQNVMQTANPAKGVVNLVDALSEGTPAIVWADMWSLPYNVLSHDDGMWAMFPILVYGYDEASGVVSVADRARIGLTVATDQLAIARGRVKKDKHRIVMLEAPDPDKLLAAVSAGIWDSIKLFTEKPPKGSRNNFGLAAYQRWAKLLTQPKARMSWEREFPRGTKLLAGLSSAFTDIRTFGKDTPAERDMFAAFLDEAAIILGRSTLNEAATQFRLSAEAWLALSEMMLPQSVAELREVRELMLRRHGAFLDEGNGATAKMIEIDARLAALRKQMAQDFPMTQAEVETLRAQMADQIMSIHDLEATAVGVMREAMSADSPD